MLRISRSTAVTDLIVTRAVSATAIAELLVLITTHLLAKLMPPLYAFSRNFPCILRSRTLGRFAYSLEHTQIDRQTAPSLF